MFEKMVVGLLKEHLGAYVKVSRAEKEKICGRILLVIPHLVSILE